ncbi:hypothetical protein SH139x_001397 [Planctomycetaceae bacterium SH139]
MSVSSCPRCHESVQLPATSADRLVRCPWCQADYPLAEALRALPPMLEVLGEPELDQPELEAIHFDRPELGQPVLESAASSFAGFELQADDQPATFDSQFSALPADQERVLPTRRRRQSSPLVGILKAAGGGVVGILLALLILQQMGRLDDMGFWPFRGPQAPLWGSGAAGGGTVRRAAPLSQSSPTEPSQNNSRAGDAEPTAPQPVTGRELALPEFDQTDPADDLTVDDFSADEMPADEIPAEPSAVAKRLEQIDQLVAAYPAAEDRRAVAGELVDQFVALGELAEQVGRFSASELEQLDAIMTSIRERLDLLRDLLDITEQRPPGPVGSGVLAIGRVEFQEGQMMLRGKNQDSPRRKLSMLNAAFVVEAGAGLFLVGVHDVDQGLKIHYASGLSNKTR